MDIKVKVPQEHVHVFRIYGERVKADNPMYTGTTGDKAFLIRKCKCGHSAVFEYGEYKQMIEMHKKLTHGK